MGAWAWTMPVLAILGLGVLCWRISRIRDGRVAALLFGLLFVLVTLLLNTAPVYIAMDEALGEKNIAYWFVQMSWMLSMIAFASSFAHGMGTTVRRALWASFAVAAVIGLVGVALVPAEWDSTPRLTGYRDTLPALLLTMPTNVVSAFAAVLVVWATLRALGSSDPRPLPRKAGMVLVAAGFVVGLLSVVSRTAAVIAGRSDDIQIIDGVMVAATILLILIGSAVLAVGRPRSLQPQR